MTNGLLKSNWIACATHLVTALIILVLYIKWPASHDRSVVSTYRYKLAGPLGDPVDTCRTSTEVSGECSVDFAYQLPTKQIGIHVIYGCIAFFAITAGAHAFYATDGFGSGAYLNAIREGWNPFRWYEYAASASLMTVLIGLSTGTRDLPTLILGALLTMGMQFNGFSIESLLRGTSSVTKHARDTISSSTLSAWCLFVGLWAVLYYNFAFVVKDVKDLYAGETDPTSGQPIKVPEWIWFVVLLQLVYYASFGIVQAMHVNKRLHNMPFTYADTEHSYIFLSYFAKLSLASGLSYGLLFRTKDCPT